MNTYKIGQQVNYTNGTLSIYTGIIAGIKNNGTQLIVVDCAAAIELFNAGYSVGSCITPAQIDNAETVENEVEYEAIR